MSSNKNLNSLDRSKFAGLYILDHIFGKKRVDKIFQRSRKSLTARQVGALSKHGKAKIIPVDRVRDISIEDFQKKYFKKGIPVILEGAASNWVASKQWDLDFFAENYGNTESLLVGMPGFTSKKQDTGFSWTNLKNIINDIKAGTDRYLRISPLLHRHPELLKDLDFDHLKKFIPGNPFAESYQIWIGGKNSITHLHSDQPCNFNVQIFGEKKWTLIPPHYTSALNPHANSTAIFTTDFNIEEPNYIDFPVMEYVDTYEAHLKPGDVLYNPPFVWHHVKSLTPSISVGYRFSSLYAALNSSLFLFLMRICATNPNLRQTMKLCKTDSNLVWAHYTGRLEEVLKARSNKPTQTPAHRKKHTPVSHI